MNSPIYSQTIDGVAVLTITNAPVNSISAAVRVELAAAMKRAGDDLGVVALVLRGAGDVFCGGAEVREFNTPQQRQAPTLPELNVLQDACPKPLVAAIAGFALGGGLELALACHWRVALPRARFALPEVKLGLMPGAGGTQRLPRVVPMADALKMMITGSAIDTAAAARHGLVDEVIQGDLTTGAVAFARRMAAREDGGLRRVRDLPARAADDSAKVLEETRLKLSGQPRASRGALDIATIRKHYETEVAKGRLGTQAGEYRIALVRATPALKDAAEADVVIEAAFERMDVKQDIFRALDRIAKPGAVLATNTSTLDVNLIAAATSRPQDVVGLHFFSPAHLMRLLELVRCDHTGDDVLATAMHLGKLLGKVSVVSGVCDGFIGNRMLQKYLQQALFLLDEGCTPQQVDQAMEDWGMAMGPFAVGDLAGLDIGWAVRKRRREEGSTMVYSPIADRICEAGRFGQKNGKGWYRYEAGSRTRLPDPEVDHLLADHRKALGIQPREIAPSEITERLLFALVNEGAAIFEEGIAQRASDIDVVWMTGYGFPAFKGGPLFDADTRGLATVLDGIERLSRGYQGAQWSISPLLRRLGVEGGSFKSLPSHTPHNH